MPDTVWTGYQAVCPEDLSIFWKAVSDRSFQPLLVSRHEDGCRYRFLCSAPATADPPRNYIVNISIYRFSADTGSSPAIVTGMCELGCCC